MLDKGKKLLSAAQGMDLILEMALMNKNYTSAHVFINLIDTALLSQEDLIGFFFQQGFEDVYAD